MPVTETYTTLGESTLDTSYTSGGVTLSPTSAASFPATGVFRVRVDNEIFKVTAVAGGDFTVVGAQEGTSAANHSSGATITEVVTAASLNAIRGEGPGPIDRLGFQNFADLSWLTTQGTAGGNDDGGRLTITEAANNGFNFRILGKSLSGATTFIVWCVPTIYFADFQRVGIVMRESGTGKILWLGLYGSTDRKIRVENWTDANNLSATVYDQATRYQNTSFTFGVWFKIVYDLTNVVCSVSHDGKDWEQVNTQLKTVPFTAAPNELGLGLLSGNGNVFACALTVLSWTET